jgi:hypothetical protein
MVNGNLHRDIGMHAQVIECNAELIACELPEDSIVDGHR